MNQDDLNSSNANLKIKYTLQKTKLVAKLIVTFSLATYYIVITYNMPSI